MAGEIMRCERLVSGARESRTFARDVEKEQDSAFSTTC
jgi:hypothetical protein